MEPNALTSKTAAGYIGMSESWLRKTRMEGNPDGPPFCKIGKACRYLISDLDAWLLDRRHVIPELSPSRRTTSDTEAA